MTISGTVTNDVTLTTTGTYASPLLITSTGAVLPSSVGAAIYGPNTQAWTVLNFGTVQNSGNAIFLANGGVISNGTTGGKVGLISGATGITVKLAAGTVTNEGTVSGSTGIYLDAGGTITNGVSGATAALISGTQYSIRIRAVAATVNNAGTIGGTSGAGINLEAGGAVANGISSATVALITGIVAGVRAQGAATTVTNAGTIIATNSNGIGVNLYSGGGSVSNGLSGATTALISANNGGIYVKGSLGTVSNAATIIGTASNGINLVSGGTVANGVSGATAALISGGNDGVLVQGAAGSVTNAATINATGSAGSGVELDHGGNITNGVSATAALISGGGTGIRVQGAAGSVANYGTVVGTAGIGVKFFGTYNDTLTNAGRIAGSAGSDAVLFAGGNDRLIVDPGAVFAGNVDGGTGTNTLELGSAASSGTLSGLGTSITNFTAIQFDSGAQWLLGGNTAGLTAGPITGFTIGDTIDLTGFVAVSESFSSNALVLTNSVSNHVTLGIQGSFSTGSFLIPGDGSGGTDITIACFCRGTLILTPDGEVPVEELAIGDSVVTFLGEAKPIKWIGRRAYEGHFIAGKREVLPICVTAGALADGMPARDLWVSPAHALYIDGVLVPSEHLVNGATFLQADSIERVEYFHIELEAHDIIFAEGMPAETYVDCDNRLMFHNAGEFAALYPGYEGANWAFCAPRLEAGSAELIAIREALFERAAMFGHPLDPDPDLHLIVDGAIVRPESAGACRYRFTIPAGSRAVSIASRSQMPAAVDSRSSDRRRLGVPVERIALSDGEMSIEAWHGHPTLCEGFHEDEAGHRWTDGLACLPETWLRSFPGGATLDLHLISTEHCYRLPPPFRGAAAA